MGDSERAVHDPASLPAAPAEATPRAGGQTILVVDDEELVRAYVATALRAAGYEVLTASDGREAMRVVYGEARTPALLLTDIDMPGMGGVELAARLTAERPGMQVLLMTGRPESVEPALDRAVVAGVLLKPFSTDELWQAVARCVPPAAAE